MKKITYNLRNTNTPTDVLHLINRLTHQPITTIKKNERELLIKFLKGCTLTINDNVEFNLANDNIVRVPQTKKELLLEYYNNEYG